MPLLEFWDKNQQQMYENQPKSSVKPNEHEHTNTTRTHIQNMSTHVQCLAAK